MNNMYVTSVVGAPSLTAVIFCNEDMKNINWKSIAEEAYLRLNNNDIKLSKMAIVVPKSEDEFDFKFIQVKNQNDEVTFETNANCGNSMLASAKIIFNLYKNKSVVITNIDTKFKLLVEDKEDTFCYRVLSIENKNIDSFKMFENEHDFCIIFNGKIIKYSLINAVNEYILINAEDIGINSKEQLLELDNEDNKYLPIVKAIRKMIIEKYNMDRESEFPKIAVIYSKDDLAARTVYLDKWHSGLPITGTITIMLATKMKGTIIYDCNNNKEKILTPKGEKMLKVDIDDNGKVKMILGTLSKIGDLQRIQKIG